MNMLFDLDGTLTDSRPGILESMRYALRALGIDPPADDALERLIGPPTHDAFRELLGSDDVRLIERAISKYRERFSSIGMFENSVYAGVHDGLVRLASASIKMWVVTSKPKVYADKIVDHFDLRRLFIDVYGSQLSGELGQKGDLIEHVLRAERLNPDETWMIGDRKHDVIGARANGVHAVGVLWGYGSREELIRAGADSVFASMSELVAAFLPRAIG
jgi:phosphoglycolate phosphatase